MKATPQFYWCRWEIKLSNWLSYHSQIGESVVIFSQSYLAKVLSLYPVYIKHNEGAAGMLDVIDSDGHS